MVITDGGKEDFGVDTNYVKVPKTKYAINMPLTQFGADLSVMRLYHGYDRRRGRQRLQGRMEDRRRRKMHPRKRNDRAIEYECTRRENKGEHYVKKDKYFYKKNDIFEITSDVKKIVEESGDKRGNLCGVHTSYYSSDCIQLRCEPGSHRSGRCNPF